MTTPLPPKGTVLATLSEIQDPGGYPTEYEDLPIIVVRSGDIVRAYINVCPHAGRPLSLPSGKMLISKGEHIVCPFHGASFAVDSGACTGGPAGNAGLKPIPVRVADGQVVVA